VVLKTLKVRLGFASSFVANSKCIRNSYSETFRTRSLGTRSLGRKPVSKMGLREADCEVGKWIELAQDPVQRRALVLEVLNLYVQLPKR
jgi:hypothetical protein